MGLRAWYTIALAPAAELLGLVLLYTMLVSLLLVILWVLVLTGYCLWRIRVACPGDACTMPMLLWMYCLLDTAWLVG